MDPYYVREVEREDQPDQNKMTASAWRIVQEKWDPERYDGIFVEELIGNPNEPDDDEDELWIYLFHGSIRTTIFYWKTYNEDVYKYGGHAVGGA